MFAVKVYDRHFEGVIEVKLGFFKWLQLKLTGQTFLKYDMKSGWKGKLPFYIVLCEVHKCYFLDYPHGYSQYFTCPFCLQEG